MIANTLHDRMAAAVGQRTYRAIGELTETHPETVRRYMQGQSPSAEFLGALCTAFSINGEWLLTGRGPMYAHEVKAHALKGASGGELLTAMASSIESLVERVDRLERYTQTLETLVRGSFGPAPNRPHPVSASHHSEELKPDHPAQLGATGMFALASNQGLASHQQVGRGVPSEPELGLGPLLGARSRIGSGIGLEIGPAHQSDGRAGLATRDGGGSVEPAPSLNNSVVEPLSAVARRDPAAGEAHTLGLGPGNLSVSGGLSGRAVPVAAGPIGLDSTARSDEARARRQATPIGDTKTGQTTVTDEFRSTIAGLPQLAANRPAEPRPASIHTGNSQTGNSQSIHSQTGQQGGGFTSGSQLDSRATPRPTDTGDRNLARVRPRATSLLDPAQRVRGVGDALAERPRQDAR